MTNEQEKQWRIDFEKEFLPKGYVLERGTDNPHYIDRKTHNAWLIYEAARAQAQEELDEMTQDRDRIHEDRARLVKEIDQLKQQIQVLQVEKACMKSAETGGRTTGLTTVDIHMENQKLKEDKEKIVSAFLDYQMAVHDTLWINNVRLGFESLRKLAYDYAIKRGRTPIWGDETYLGNHFQDLNSYVEQLKEENTALNNRNLQLEEFCHEFVYGEENPEYYTTLSQRIKNYHKEVAQLKEEINQERMFTDNVALQSFNQDEYVKNGCDGEYKEADHRGGYEYMIKLARQTQQKRRVLL